LISTVILNFRRKGDLHGGTPLENFDDFEAPGLNFWRFLKQIRKRIGSKLTVFYKNGYHFTKITTLLCKLREFHMRLGWGGRLPASNEVLCIHALSLKLT
jgi:hypothetical protein